ncbi:MAG: CusA/CzcA family heavy metal efflux RND transporter [Cytophagales bacterium]|nr:CusA/CzcA family heavy metal efflux RND transporter [Cytophagales bacterium]
MLTRIIKISTKSRFGVSVMVLGIILWGVVSLQKLPIDAIPDITNKQVTVFNLSPNLGAVEVERFVTTPIEIEMSNILGIDHIRSISRFGLSSVTIVFNDDADLYRSRQLVFEKLANVQNSLPQNTGFSEMAPITTGIGEIYQYVIVPADANDNSFSLMEIRTIQDWVVRKNLLGTPGVTDISSFGGYKKEYHAKLNTESMKAYDVTIDELFEALNKGNNNTGGSYIEKDNRAYIIRGLGLAKNIDDIENTLIKIHDNNPVLIKHVADVSIESATRYGAMTMDGQGEVVGGVVLLQMGENASKVIDELEKRIENIQTMLPKGLVIKPFINRKALVDRTIHTVIKNLSEGAIIVILVLLLFLGDIKASLIAGSVIPLAMLFTFGMMQLTGVVGNLMSLGALDFGLIVDGSVIIVESIMIALATMYHSKKSGDIYKNRQNMVIEGVESVKNSVFFGTIIILVVYFPILFLSGVEGKMFKPMALTVLYAIVGALILSFTYVPMMCAWLLHSHEHKKGIPDIIVDFLYLKIYMPVFNISINNKKWVLTVIIFILILSGYIFTRTGGEFIPKLDEGDIQIETRLPIGTSLTQSINASMQIEKKLLEKFPDEIKSVIGKTGTSEIPIDPVPFESTDILITTHEQSKWVKARNKPELLDLIMAEYEKLPGVTASLQQPIEARFNDLLSGAKTDVVFKIFGSDIDMLTQIAKKVMVELNATQGAKDVQMQILTGMPQIQIEYNRKDIAVYGISIDQINDLIETAFAGKVTGYIYQDDRKYNLVVKLRNVNRNNVETFYALSIKNHHGVPIPLRELVTINTEVGPSEIRHYNKKRYIQVGANVRGRDIESLVLEAQNKINQNVSLPFGYFLETGGQYENLRKAKERLMIVIPIALIIIIGLLFASLSSMLDALLIFSAVPLSAIGGIFALYITGINFSISAGVGFICLFGISVLNGIMLINHFKQMDISAFKNIQTLVIQGVKEKFRPVLMTAIVAALGFLPMTLATGAGAEVQRPLAVVVIGGLIVSTALSLIVLPIAYIITRKLYQNLNKS